MAADIITFPQRQSKTPPAQEIRVGDCVRVRADGQIGRVYMIECANLRIFIEIADGLHRGTIRCVGPDDIEPWPPGGEAA